MAGSIHYFDWAMASSSLFVCRNQAGSSPWDDDHSPEGEAEHFIIVIKGNHPQIAELLIYEYRLLISEIWKVSEIWNHPLVSEIW